MILDKNLEEKIQYTVKGKYPVPLQRKTATVANPEESTEF